MVCRTHYCSRHYCSRRSAGEQNLLTKKLNIFPKEASKRLFSSHTLFFSYSINIFGEGIVGNMVTFLIQNKDLLVKTLTGDDLDFNEDIENNADLCAAACAKTSGCLSFELPFSKRHYWWPDNYRCNLFFMPCKTRYDGPDSESSVRFWSSYQMGCFDEKCKNEWLDESHVSIYFW